MGELIPYCYTRLNSGLTMANWLLGAQQGKNRPEDGSQVMRESVGFYLKRNVFITSSGVFDQPVFDCARAMLGLDHLLFSVDYPLQDNFAAMEFLAAAGLSAEDKERFAHGTAERLLKFDTPTAVTSASRPRIGDSAYAVGARLRSKVGRALISALVR
jgi:hypothetical protein